MVSNANVHQLTVCPFLSVSRLAMAMASVYSVLPKITLRAFLCMDSKRSSRYDSSTAQMGEAYLMTDLTKLQSTSTNSSQFNPAFSREHKVYSRFRALLCMWSQCSFQVTCTSCDIITPNSL